MASVSVVPTSLLVRQKRCDAEYYQKKYLEYDKLMDKNNWLPLKKYFSSCDYGISIKMNEDSKGEKIFRMDDLKKGFAVDYNMKYADVDQNTVNRYEVKYNDVLFNRVNSEEFVGRTGIFKLKKKYIFASYLVRVKANSSITPDVINIFLNCKFGKSSIKRLSRRAVNQANVNAQELKSIRIPNITKKNITNLTNLSNMSWDFYEKSNLLYDKAEKLLLHTLNFKKLKINNDITFSEKYKNVVASGRIDAEHFMPKYKSITSHIKNYSNGYKRLIDFISVSKEKIDPKLNPAKEIKYVELSDINHLVGTIESSSEIQGKFAPSRARMLLKENDIIVSSVEGSFNKSAIVPDEFNKSVGSTGFFVFKSKQNQPGYVLALIKSIFFKEQMHREASGTILTAVSDKSLKNILIPILPNKTVNEINKLIIESHKFQKKALKIFNVAKTALEIYIEKNESLSLEYIRKNIK